MCVCQVEDVGGGGGVSPHVVWSEVWSDKCYGVHPDGIIPNIYTSNVGCLSVCLGLASDWSNFW